jgi:hypothetical protein
MESEHQPFNSVWQSAGLLRDSAFRGLRHGPIAVGSQWRAAAHPLNSPHRISVADECEWRVLSTAELEIQSLGSIDLDRA